MSDYFKDHAATEAFAKTLLSDSDMRLLVSCAAPIPASKSREFLVCRESVVISRVRHATAQAADLKIKDLEAENAELRSLLAAFISEKGGK